MKVREFIEELESDIQQLLEDKKVVKNEVTERVIQWSIDNRQQRIVELHEKYLND